MKTLIITLLTTISSLLYLKLVSAIGIFIIVLKSVLLGWLQRRVGPNLVERVFLYIQFFYRSDEDGIFFMHKRNLIKQNYSNRNNTNKKPNQFISNKYNFYNILEFCVKFFWSFLASFLLFNINKNIIIMSVFSVLWTILILFFLEIFINKQKFNYSRLLYRYIFIYCSTIVLLHLNLFMSSLYLDLYIYIVLLIYLILTIVQKDIYEVYFLLFGMFFISFLFLLVDLNPI